MSEAKSDQVSISGETFSPNPYFPQEFYDAIPKSDLHVHLDGSLRIETLIDLAKIYNVELPSYTVDGLKEKVFKKQYADLLEYLAGFKYTCAVLQTSYALDRVSYELAVDNYKEGTRYFEVRFAPQLHVQINKENNDLSDIACVIRAVNSGLKRARDEFNEKDEEVKSGVAPGFEYGIIVCAMRYWNSKFSGYYAHFADIHQNEPEVRVRGLASMSLVTSAVHCRDVDKIPVVAFDLAGPEKGFPAEDHREAFEYAQLHFLAKTVHAGEGYGPDSIFQAISKLYAQRIGHGFHLFSTELITDPKYPDRETWNNQLINFVAEHRIAVEVCLSSNLQTMPELNGSLSNHAFRRMLISRLSVTLGTDNRLISNTNVTTELKLACDAFCLNPGELKEITINGFKRSFFHSNYVDKRHYVRKVFRYYEMLEEKFGVNQNGHDYVPHMTRADSLADIKVNEKKKSLTPV